MIWQLECIAEETLDERVKCLKGIVVVTGTVEMCRGEYGYTNHVNLVVDTNYCVTFVQRSQQCCTFCLNSVTN